MNEEGHERTQLAATFLLALAPALLLDAWNARVTAVLRAHLYARETLAEMVLMQLTHLLLMGKLMLGWGPLPKLGAESAAYRFAFVSSLAAVGTMGAAALATHAYVQQVIMVVLLFGLAAGLSVEVLVGAGHLRQAYALVHRALARGLMVSVAVATAAARASPWLLQLEWLRGLLMWHRWQRLAWVSHAKASRRRLGAGAVKRRRTRL